MTTNNISNIYSTVSDYRTHIAADKEYVGNVNSYNNWLTKFFAWVFQLAIDVNVDGKVRYVNKKSYLKLLQNLSNTDATLDNLSDYTKFRDVAEKSTLPTGKMIREAISTSKRNSLFRKLARAISRGYTEKALKVIGQGATLESRYFDRGHQGVSFHCVNYDLSRDRSYKFTVFNGTPILHAARKANTLVAQRLKEYGASTEVVGQQHTFERVITGVSRHYDLDVVPTVGFGCHGRANYGYGLQSRETTFVHTSDSMKDQTNLRLDDSLNLDNADNA